MWSTMLHYICASYGSYSTKYTSMYPVNLGCEIAKHAPAYKMSPRKHCQETSEITIVSCYISYATKYKPLTLPFNEETEEKTSAFVFKSPNSKEINTPQSDIYGMSCSKTKMSGSELSVRQKAEHSKE